METSHNPVRHLQYLRQSLSQDSKPISCFLSAGCPLSVEMEDGKWPLIPDVKNLSLYINKELFENTSYQTLLSELTKSGKNQENVEDVLSFIRGLLEVAKGGTVRGLKEEDLINLDELVCEKVKEKVDVLLPESETSYHKLANWIRSIDRKTPIEIFTTNYDLLMEQALDSLEIPYFDGFVGSRRPFFDLKAVEDNLIPLHWSRLWKVHGSINWYSEKFQGRIKVYRSSEIKKYASKLIYPSHLKYDESRKMPYLALIDQLNRFIREKSSFLILSGYSFSDDHLNGTIVNALKSNPTAMVLGLMYGEYEEDGKLRYPKAYDLAKNQHNLNIWTFDKAIIGTNVGEWKIPDSEEDIDSDIKAFIDCLDNADDNVPNKRAIKLGDFSKFTDFLKRTIGVHEELRHEQ
ncbi:MAG: SIR2 family protein [Sedimenticola sp.]